MLSAAELTMALLNEFHSREFPYVYLRNHEALPDEVGNDVDLLVPCGCRKIYEKQLVLHAGKLGWRHLKTAEFGPRAVYLANPQSGETLHIDLFDRIEWHALEFADARKLFDRRLWSGLVHIPSQADELFLNLVTRLIYHAQVRPKHREQAKAFVAKHGLADLRSAFNCHLAGPGDRLALVLASADWEATAKIRLIARLAALRHHGLRRPLRLLSGLVRYGIRIVKKLLRPPGAFLAFVGADGVAKSTLLGQITPWCMEWNAGRTPYRFRWDPCRQVRNERIPPG